MTEPSTTAMDCREIMRVLPHRYPFLLVDRILEIESGKRAVGIKNVTANEPQFTGHFPDRPIMPGVLIVEALAQAGGILAIESLGLGGSGKLVYFMGIDGVKFRKPVEPGCLLDLHVTILQAKRSICKFEGRAMLGDNLATECQFTAMIADPPTD